MNNGRHIFVDHAIGPPRREVDPLADDAAFGQQQQDLPLCCPEPPFAVLDCDAEAVGHLDAVAVMATPTSDAQTRTAADPVTRAADDTLDGLGRLINELVRAGRFDEVMRVAPIGSALQRVRTMTTSDFLRREQRQQQEHAAAYGMGNGFGGWMNGGVVGGMNYVGALPAVGGGGNDTHALHREMLLSLDKASKMLQSTRTSAEARDEADELRSIREAMEGMPDAERAKLALRVTTLVDRIAARADKQTSADAAAATPTTVKENDHAHGQQLIDIGG